MKDIIEQFEYGLITEKEMKDKLDKIGIRGAYHIDHFIGYDYNNQKWIDTTKDNFIGLFKNADTGIIKKVYTDNNGLLSI